MTLQYRGVHRARPHPWRRLAASALALSLALGSVTPAFAEPLSLEAALAQAGAADPGLAGATARLASAEARARQAGLRPNPTLGADLENFAGTGDYGLLGAPEATFYYEQTLERGGKPAARTGLARAELEVARWRGRAARLDYLREVQIAWTEAMSAEAEVVIAEARYVAARTAQTDIQRRVQAARDPLFAAARAETQTAEAEIALARARTEARDAKLALAALWGGGADFDLDVNLFFQIGDALALAPDAESPDLALLAAEREAAIARIAVEKAGAVPDPRVRGGFRYLGDSGDVAVIIGGSIPLRRFDTNREGVARASADRTAAEADLEAARVGGEREIARLQARIVASASQAERIRTQVIPAALEAVRLVREGFARGGFQYIDVTDAERALAEARMRRVEILKSLHLDRAALDRLTGRHLGLVISAETRS